MCLKGHMHLMDVDDCVNDTEWLCLMADALLPCACAQHFTVGLGHEDGMCVCVWCVCLWV